MMKKVDKTKKLCFDTRETSEDMGKELANPCRLYSHSISLVIHLVISINWFQLNISYSIN